MYVARVQVDVRGARASGCTWRAGNFVCVSRGQDKACVGRTMTGVCLYDNVRVERARRRAWNVP